MNDEKIDKFRKRYKKLTIAELHQIVEYYREHFPTWKVIEKGTLVREDGPVAQAITFERLSGGEYRPTGHIHVLVVPADHWYFELPQDLNIKVRQINRRQDREYRPRVLEAIRADFVPSVDRPLVAEEVLKLYEQQSVPETTGAAYSLAALNAYLGHEERALHWCSQHTKLLDEKTRNGFPWHELEHKQQAFLQDLEKWIKGGEAKQQLEHVLQEERRKWGLA